ncbi:DUF3016 domain-containing protein [Massilia suwonensis]|uniref:DUF3016 domain-containing protein n=1 Tax=Massilia suwonensis TaxID=648895 RepID=A0ABW0MUC4_9BURK
MKNVIRMLAAGGLWALVVGSASAEVVVNYVQSDRFTDLPRMQQEREQVLAELTKHLTKLGADLPAGQTLRIDVDDIDLAGRRLPTTGTREERMFHSAVDWPRIELEYEVESNGQIVRSGKVALRDMAYLSRTQRYFDGDPLRFEKPMINEWFYTAVAPRERTASR